ncbi:TRAP transporter small permease [Rhodovibrionaceae bacterium A322]
MRRIGEIVNTIEEGAIALLLGLMTVITFANVVARYVFNDNILWALETTVFLFAWMVLLGASYCVKITAHLGVDALVAHFPPHLRKASALVAAGCCIAFAVLLFIGGWNYWWKFATTASFLEVDDIPMPDFMQFLAVWMNDGEDYEKIPRYIPYFILPLSMALLIFRFVQAAWNILLEKQTLLIVSHEAEEMVEEASAALKEKKEG